MKDFVYSFIACTGVSDRKRVFCRNERRNWRLSLQRHVRRCTFRDAYAEIAEPIDVSKPAECRNYSLRCTLCSGFSVHPFSFLTLRRCRPYALAGSHAHTFSLPPSLRFGLSGQPRSPVSRLSSCDSPTPLCVNSCTHRQRIPTGEYTAGNVYLA